MSRSSAAYASLAPQAPAASLAENCNRIAAPFTGMDAPLTEYMYAVWQRGVDMQPAYPLDTVSQRAAYIRWYLFSYCGSFPKRSGVQSAIPLEGPLADWLRAPVSEKLLRRSNTPWTPCNLEYLVITGPGAERAQFAHKTGRWNACRAWLVMESPGLLGYPSALLPDSSFAFLHARAEGLPANDDPCALSMSVRHIWNGNKAKLGASLPLTVRGRTLLTLLAHMADKDIDERALPPAMLNYLTSGGPHAESGLLRELRSCVPSTAHLKAPPEMIEQAVLAALAKLIASSPLTPRVKARHAALIDAISATGAAPDTDTASDNDAPAMAAGKTAASAPAAPPVVDLIGMSDLENGVGAAMRRCAAALDTAGIPFAIYNKSYNPGQRSQATDYSERITRKLSAPVKLIHYNPDLALRMMPEIGLGAFEGTYRIGHCPWEFPQLSAGYKAGLMMFNEIWTGSRFEAEAFTAAGIPAYCVGHPVPEPRFDPSMDRGYFGLPDGTFLFVFTYDKSSTLSRKNPQGVVEAFQRAFPGNEKVGLVIKSHSGHSKLWPRQDLAYEALAERMEEDPRIIPIEATFRGEEVNALINACDCYISLHRSEGFGFGMAEAMLLAKPVIATAYSGNADFIRPDTAFPVGAKIIPLYKEDYYYTDRDLTWGDPDIDEAARQMQKVFSDRILAETIAATGQQFIRQEYSTEAVAARYRAQFERLQALLAGRG